MFAYCQNCPVCCADPSGCRPWWERDYGNGVVGYTDAGTSAPHIYNQNDPSVADLQFGISNVASSGCGVVATYHSLLDLGDYHSFTSVLNYYNSSGSMNLFGLAGMMPKHVAKYFEDAGYHVELVTDPQSIDIASERADACIAWYMYTTNCFPFIGGHYVSFHSYASEYVAYNVYSDSNAAVHFQSPAQFTLQNGYFNAILICIYR